MISYLWSGIHEIIMIKSKLQNLVPPVSRISFQLGNHRSHRVELHMDQKRHREQLKGVPMVPSNPFIY
jgi:hypothetical protein